MVMAIMRDNRVWRLRELGLRRRNRIRYTVGQVVGQVMDLLGIMYILYRLITPETHKRLHVEAGTDYTMPMMPLQAARALYRWHQSIIWKF